MCTPAWKWTKFATSDKYSQWNVYAALSSHKTVLLLFFNHLFQKKIKPNYEQLMGCSWKHYTITTGNDFHIKMDGNEVHFNVSLIEGQSHEKEPINHSLSKRKEWSREPNQCHCLLPRLTPYCQARQTHTPLPGQTNSHTTAMPNWLAHHCHKAVCTLGNHQSLEYFHPDQYYLILHQVSSLNGYFDNQKLSLRDRIIFSCWCFRRRRTDMDCT